MDFGLKGRAAIVAASSSGLGLATAMELAYEGASVTINGRTQEELRRAADEIQSATGREVLAVAGDVTSEEVIREMVSETKVRFGRVDIAVANAGGPPAGFFGDFTAEHYRDAVELNLLSTINLCREAVPRMRERGW